MVLEKTKRLENDWLMPNFKIENFIKLIFDLSLSVFIKINIFTSWNLPYQN